MSLAATSWALRQAPLKRDASQCRNRLVLVALADRFNDDTGVCWPSIGSIADDVGVSVRTVQKAINTLEEAGLIRRGDPYWVQHLPAGKRPTVWVLNLGMVKPRKPPKSDTNFTGGVNTHSPVNTPTGVNTPSPHGVNTCSGDGVNTSSDDGVKACSYKPKVEPKVEPKEESKDRSISDAFDRFWNLVPRKAAKGAARKAFEKAAKRAPLEEIIDGMARYRNDPNREAEFTKHPATWLNQDCWEDDPIPARSSDSGRGVQNTLDAWEYGPQGASRAIDGEVVQMGELPW